MKRIWNTFLASIFLFTNISLADNFIGPKIQTTTPTIKSQDLIVGPHLALPKNVVNSSDYYIVKASAKTDISPDCTNSYYEMQMAVNGYKKDIALATGSVIAIFLIPPPGDIIAAFAFLGSMFDAYGADIKVKQTTYNYSMCLNNREVK